MPAEEKPKPAQKAEKIKITPQLRRLWLTVRKAWVSSFQAFSNSLSSLDQKQAAMLYEVVKHSLFKDSYVQILRGHPELREFLKSDDDRLCMHDIYEVLSWRLSRKEKLPKDVEMAEKMKGRIGRSVPEMPYEPLHK